MITADSGTPDRFGAAASSAAFAIDVLDIDMVLARGGANCTRLQQTRGGLTIDLVKVITRCRRLLYTIARRAGGDSAGRQRCAAQGSSPMR